MKHAVLFLIAAVSLALAGGQAQADGFDFRRGFELQIGGSAGGAAVEWIDPSEGSTTRTLALNAFARIRHPRTPFGFEQALVVPHGMLSALLLDAWRAERWRVHVNLGVFVPVAKRYLSTEAIDRSWDAVAGLGAEAMVRKRLAVTADWRVFLAAPTSIPWIYGDFTRSVYKEAQRGGQLWFGASWVY